MDEKLLDRVEDYVLSRWNGAEEGEIADSLSCEVAEALGLNHIDVIEVLNELETLGRLRSEALPLTMRWMRAAPGQEPL